MRVRVRRFARDRWSANNHTLDGLPTVRYICIQLDLPQLMSAAAHDSRSTWGAHGSRQIGGPAIQCRQH